MTSTFYISEFQKIIAKYCKEFKEYIHNIIEGAFADFHFDKLARNNNLFPLFDTANFGFYQHVQFEKYLNYGIYDSFLYHAIRDALKMHNIAIDKEEKYNYLALPTVQRIEQKRKFCYIVEKDGIRTGYRYTETIDDPNLLIEKYALDSICDIYVDYPEAVDEREIKYVFSGCEEIVSRITLQDFFQTYLSEEEYSIFKDNVQQAIDSVTHLMGFQTVQQLSPKALSDFKESVLNVLANMEYESLQYYNIVKSKDNGKERIIIIRNPITLSEATYTIMTNRFKAQGLYKALTGTSAFAKCFITSEYLYKMNEKIRGHIDYTSIISGYLKCIEILLHEAVKANLKIPTAKKYYITCKETESELIKNKVHYMSNDKYRYVTFCPENEIYFKCDMGSYINFLKFSKGLWYCCQIDIAGIINWLECFTKECRNENFHKDLVNDWDIVTAIRNNTLLLCYAVIGSRKLTDNADSDREQLCIYDDSFDRLYKKLQKIPASQYCFYIKFSEKEEIRAIRLLNQPYSVYDSFGTLGDSIIRFVQVNDFSDYNSEEYNAFLDSITSDNEIVIHKNNMPEKIWWYNSKAGKRSIDW